MDDFGDCSGSENVCLLRLAVTVLADGRSGRSVISLDGYLVSDVVGVDDEAANAIIAEFFLIFNETNFYFPLHHNFLVATGEDVFVGVVRSPLCRF